jgi:DNA-binding MurR/RpiR family transcriptional regulator
MQYHCRVKSNDARALQLPLERIGVEVQDLPPAERRTAEALLAAYARLDGETTASIARSADVDPATVVRTTRKLGFGGFGEMKLAAARATGYVEASASEDVDDRSDAGLVAHSMSVDANQTRLVAEVLDGALLGVIADRLLEADHVVFAAVGSSSTLMSLVALRFLSLGIRVTWFGDSQAQLTAAELLGERGSVLALSRSGRSPEVLAVAKAAKSRGADVSLITVARQSPLARVVDRSLVLAPPSKAKSEQFLSRSVDMAVLNALEALVFRRLRERASPKRSKARR